MAEPKKAHKEVHKPLEHKISRRDFIKFFGTTLVGAAVLSPFSLDLNKLFKGKEGMTLSRAGAEEQKYPTIDVKEVEDAIANTQKLIREGKVEIVEIPYWENKPMKIKIKEWIIHYGGEGFEDFASTRVVNTLAERGYNKKIGYVDRDAPFVTATLSNEWRNEKGIVKGYVVQRPDDPSQTVLVLACKDHLDFYVLNEKKEIEWIPIILKDVGIERKPEILFVSQNIDTDIGKAIVLLVMDAKNYEKLVAESASKDEVIKLLRAVIIPHPEDEPGKKMQAFGTGDKILYANVR